MSPDLDAIVRRAAWLWNDAKRIVPDDEVLTREDERVFEEEQQILTRDVPALVELARRQRALLERVYQEYVDGEGYVDEELRAFLA